MESENGAAETTTTGTRPGDSYLIVQAALFYLEAAAISIILAALGGSIAFGVLSWLVKLTGLEQGDGSIIAMVPLVLAVAAAITVLVLVFRTYFRLLANPAAGHIICAIGALLWALPVGLIAPLALKPIIPDYKLLGTWIAYLAAAGLIYWLKRRVVR